MKLYKCNHCGNIATKIYDKGVPLVCCGEEMIELKANTQDAALEKHVPVITIDGDIATVKIGEVEHPMVKEHYITSIYIENGSNTKVAILDPSDKPHASFKIDKTKPVKAYEYCNVHGLWSAKID